MSAYALPILYALFVWWFSTGLILYLDRLPRHTFRWSLLGATVFMGTGLYGLAVSGADATVAGAYTGFTCALLVWAWHEVSFLMGFVTGTRTSPCPPEIRGWQRFVAATQAILWHELAILASAVLVVTLTWGAPNQVGTWTFLLLWLMRLSTKLNLFLGVPNLAEGLLPDHLRYLASFLARRPMNLLFPVSVTLSTVIAGCFVQNALAAEAVAFEVAAFTFLAALTTLAVLEHWFLVLPLPVEALWAWSLRQSGAKPPLTEPALTRLIVTR